jgi:hypothetical protein
MVHDQVKPLLALGLAGLERAKSLFVLRLVWHAVTLILLGLAATALTFLHGKQNESVVFAIESTAASLAIVTELLALFTHHSALEAHSQGRQVMRRVMLLDARRPQDAGLYLDHVRLEFSKSVRDAAEQKIADDPREGPAQHQLQRYYASERPPGLERLRDHLLESAMFTERLYRAGWIFSAVMLTIFLTGTAIVIGLMIARGFGPQEHWGQFGVRLLIAILAFIPASQELDHALLYRTMSSEVKKLIKRVEDLWDSKIPQEQLDLRLTADVGDYGADTTSAPPIRSLLYNWLDPRLNTVVLARLAELNRRANPGASPSVG